tara:strand:+ start:11029 stop:11199 length:171 start_codon:yes stop_codon:yes gene_type:complete
MARHADCVVVPGQVQKVEGAMARLLLGEVLYEQVRLVGSVKCGGTSEGAVQRIRKE